VGEWGKETEGIEIKITCRLDFPMLVFKIDVILFIVARANKRETVLFDELLTLLFQHAILFWHDS